MGITPDAVPFIIGAFALVLPATMGFFMAWRASHARVHAAITPKAMERARILYGIGWGTFLVSWLSANIALVTIWALNMTDSPTFPLGKLFALNMLTFGFNLVFAYLLKQVHVARHEEYSSHVHMRTWELVVDNGKSSTPQRFNLGKSQKGTHDTRQLAPQNIYTERNKNTCPP